MTKEQERALAKIADYQQVFNTSAGQRVLHDLVKNFLLVNPHVEKDPYSSAFNAGAQSVVQTIIQKLKYDIKKVTEMLKEHEEGVDDESI